MIRDKLVFRSVYRELTTRGPHFSVETEVFVLPGGRLGSDTAGFVEQVVTKLSPRDSHNPHEVTRTRDFLGCARDRSLVALVEDDHDDAFYIREGVRLHDRKVRETETAVDA